jgi:hypothetical protein
VSWARQEPTFRSLRVLGVGSRAYCTTPLGTGQVSPRPESAAGRGSSRRRRGGSPGLHSRASPDLKVRPTLSVTSSTAPAHPSETRVCLPV